MGFLKSMVGRKIVMAVSGSMMVLFVMAHLMGNSSIFVGPNGINAYAMKLHAFGPVVWAYRLVMIIMVSLHVLFGTQLTLENNKAKPQGYAVKKNLSATFAGRNMIWTGLILGAFLVYHLLQFTVQVTNPGISAGSNMDAAGRPDVFHMVVLSFQQSIVAVIYICAMIALGLHLTHGIQSFFQTLGLSSDRALPVIVKFGTAAAIVIFLGYVAIPLIILAGILKG
jgi:succinate dehydrogenase / fumarate reductase cytochrome b subunit